MSNFTAVKTAAQAMDRRDAKIKQLTESLTADPEVVQAKRVLDFAMELAFIEGTIEMLSIVQVHEEVALDLGLSPAETAFKVTRAVTMQLSHGVDDTWSGRGNDLARVRYEGKLAVAEDVAWRMDKLATEGK